MSSNDINNEWKDQLIFISTGLSRILKSNFELKFKDFYALSNNLKVSSDLIKYNKSHFKTLSQNLNLSFKRKLINSREKYTNFTRLIESNSIHGNLKKGYSILSKGRRIINDSKLIKENDTISARLIDKKIDIKIKKIN